MPASRTDISRLPSSLVVEATGAQIHIPRENIQLRRHGIEFKSPRPFELWTEMTVALDAPPGGRKVQGTGVVVASEGDRHRGFSISVLFLDLAPAYPASEWTAERSGLS